MRRYFEWLIDLKTVRGQAAVNIGASLFVGLLGAGLFIDRLILASLVVDPPTASVQIVPWVVLLVRAIIVLTIIALPYWWWQRAMKRADESLLHRFIENTRLIRTVTPVPTYEYQLDQRTFRVGLTPDEDFFKINWTVSNASGPLTYLFFDWRSEERLLDLPELNTSASEGNAIPLPTRNDVHQKGWLIAITPHEIATDRMIEISFSWPGFWRPLRRGLPDYIDYVSKATTQEAKIAIEVPVGIGRARWDERRNPSRMPGVTLGADPSPDKTVLRLEIHRPSPNKPYRYYFCTNDRA